MANIRFSIETTYTQGNNDDDTNDVYSVVTMQNYSIGDFVRDLDTVTALEAFLMMSENLAIENNLINRAIRESEQESELHRDRSKCIQVVPRKFDAAKDADCQCSICMSKFMADQDLVTLLCQHTFHKKCIEEWGHYKPECPLCKKSIPLVKENLVDDKDGMEQTNATME